MRKKFDKEFKKKAVELSYARGNATEIAEELGLDRVLLQAIGYKKRIKI